MDREAVLATIDALYRIRIAGQTDPMAAYLAEGATFRLAGEGQMEGTFGQPGPVDFLTAMGGLNGGIAMLEVNRKTAIAEGRNCAVLMEAEVQFGARKAFKTEIFNLWSFDEAGKVTDLLEFVDTARLAEEMQMLGVTLI